MLSSWDFGVRAVGTRAVVTEKERSLYFGDITRQGLAVLRRKYPPMPCTLPWSGSRKQSCGLPHFAAPVLEAKGGWQERGADSLFAPHTLRAGSFPRADIYWKSAPLGTGSIPSARCITAMRNINGTGRILTEPGEGMERGLRGKACGHPVPGGNPGRKA